jgi:hypothetical protein
MLAAFEAAWQEVAAEEAAADPDFKRASDSLQAFRADYKICADYKIWKDLGHLGCATAGRHASDRKLAPAVSDQDRIPSNKTPRTSG